MEKAMVFKSMTAEVKFLIMEYMNEKKEAVDRSELVHLVKKNIGEDERLTDGVIAGALKMLLANGELVTVRRGCYQLGDGKAVESEKTSAFDRIYAICNKFKADLDRACTVNLLTFTGEKKELYDLMAEDLKGLRETVLVYTDHLFENILLWNEKGAEENPVGVEETPAAPMEEPAAVIPVEALAEENAQLPDKEKAEEVLQTALLVVEQPERKVEMENQTEVPTEESPTEAPVSEIPQEEKPEMQEEEKRDTAGRGKSAKKKGGKCENHKLKEERDMYKQVASKMDGYHRNQEEMKARRKPAYKNELDKQIIEMKSKGYNITDIAGALGISRGIVYNHINVLKEAGIDLSLQAYKK